MISISLCMIVRDEEKVLRRCLESVKDLVDEIVIVDTGSEDRSREIAGEFTEHVYDLEWQDDFSAARNYAFSRASGEYCMWLDADDVIPESSRHKFLQMKERLTPETDMVMLPYETAFDEGRKAVFSYYRERIVKNHRGYLFCGKVHEVIPLRGKIRRENIPVRHQPEQKRNSERNLNIYRKLEQNGEEFDSRMLYYYARELTAHGRYREGARRLRLFLRRADGWLEDKIEATRQLAVCCYQLGKEDLALQALFSGFRYDVPRAETCCMIGRHFLDRSQYVQAIFWYEQALRAKKDPESGAFIQEDCYGFLPAISLCVCYDRLGDPQKAEIYNELAGAYKPYSPFYLKNRQYFLNAFSDGREYNEGTRKNGAEG